MRYISVTLLILFTFNAFSQEDSVRKAILPSVDLKTLEGKSLNSSALTNDGKPVIISFWALWCKPCIKELNTIASVYSDWVEETGVKFFAISIDDARSSSRVKPFADGKNWDFEVLLDPNSDFKRAMNVNMIPHTFLLNGKGQIVWQHTSFTEGGELQLIELVRKLNRGEPLDH